MKYYSTNLCVGCTAKLRLLAEKELTFTKAIEIAQGMEAAARDAQLFKSNGGPINKLSQPNEPETVAKVDKLDNPAKSCYRCGKSNHLASQCKFIASVCRS